MVTQNAQFDPLKANKQAPEQAYRVLVESVRDYAIYMLDPNGVVTTWNKGAERITGYTADEIIGQHFSCFYPDDSQKRGYPEAELTETARDGRYETEGWRVRKNGERFWTHVVLTAIYGPSNDLVGFSKVTQDLTEQRQTEERLGESIKELKDIQYALDQSTIVAFTDKQGTITYVNDAFCKISKYAPEELLGQNHRIINSGHHPHEFFVNMWKTIASGKVWKGEIKNRAKDGSFYWVDTTIVPLQNQAGKAYQYVAIRHDITERKSIEEELRASIKEAKEIKFALDQSTIVAITDKQGVITYVNEAFSRISQYSPEELIGQTHRIINSTYHPHEFFKEMWSIIGHGHVWKGEIKNRAKDGSHYWVDTTIIPLKDEAGKPEQYIAIRHDITNRKKTEEELRASLKDVADIKFALDQSTIVAITDKKGDITYVNDAFCRISQYSERELLGQNHRIINSGHHPHAFFVNMWKTIASGKVWKGEIKNRAKDGSFYWVDTTLVPFVDANGKPYQYVAVRHDITNRKALELELEAAKEAAEEANKKKSQFLANMSHELRTPLNAVISYSQMLKQGIAGTISEKQHKYANNIEVSGKHLLDMVNDILDIAKIEAGKIQLSFQPIQLKPLVTDLQEVLAGMAEQKKISLDFSTDPALEILIADPARLRQIFFNLISNAIKFNTDNGQVHVRLYRSDDKQWVIGEVQDTGIGIPKDKIGELFTQFYQVDSSTSRAHEGTGLGLALTRHLVQLHGGTISVESEEGKGSIFTFKIPISPLKNSSEPNGKKQ